MTGRPVSSPSARPAEPQRDHGRAHGASHDAGGPAAPAPYTRQFDDASLPYSDGKTYFNFPGLLEEGDATVRSSYGSNYERLARIKAAYHPDNVFRLNQNIRPPRRRAPSRLDKGAPP